MVYNPHGRCLVFRSRHAHEAKEKRAPKALVGIGACPPPKKIIIIRTSEMPFSMFSRGNFDQSKHGNVDNLIVYTL